MEKRRESVTSMDVLSKITSSNPFRGKEKVELTDTQLREKIEKTDTLARTLDSKFKENYKAVKMGINVINDNVMKRVQAENQKFDAKKYYKAVCTAYTYCNEGSRSGPAESYRGTFKKAVQEYLNFVQSKNISDQGKKNAMAVLLPHLEGVPRDDKVLRELLRELRTLPDVRNKIEIHFSKTPPEKKFKLVLTGGTIGSVLVKGDIVQPSVAKEKYGLKDEEIKVSLLEEYNKKYQHQNIEIGHESIMETLSENMTIEKRVELAKKLKGILDKIKPEECNGIFLTHGSDTLGHTANFLSLLLTDMKLKVPIVLVSSNYVVTDKKANGIDNLKGAVDFLSHVNLPPNVYVTENSQFKDEIKVILASRVTQCQPITDNYRSTSIGTEGEKSMRPLGVIADRKFTVSDKELYEKLQTRQQDDRPSFNLIDRIDALEKARVLWIEHPYPGLDYSFFDFKKFDVVLHGTYHGGTACADDADVSKNESLVEFAKKCKAEGKRFYFGPLYGAAGRDVYGSTAKIVDEEADVRTLMNLSPEMAFEKVRFAALLDNEEHRNEFLYNDMNYEFVLPDTKSNR